MSIRAFELKNVGPFDDIRFEFDEHVNVFVGPNNSGKTCALMALADMVECAPSFSTRFLREEAASSAVEYEAGTGGVAVFESKFPIAVAWPHPWVGDDWCRRYYAMVQTVGFTRFVPAIRFSGDYRSKGPLQAREPYVLYHRPEFLKLPEGDEFAEVRADLERRAMLSSQSTSLVSDKEVVQTIIDLDYRSYRDSNPILRRLIEQVGAVASEITEGFPIQFVRVDEDETGLFAKFKTPDGELPLNCLSQGTQSTVQWLGQLLFNWAAFYEYAEDFLERPATLMIDEIDAHLHPSWQRRIIPALTKHFATLQLFCSTHSPLMLAGLRAGQVQLLKRDEKGRVIVSRNESDIVGWSADEILRNFLDVPAPTDLQTVEDMTRLQTLRQKLELSPQEAHELEDLRHTVGEELLGGPIAGEVSRLATRLAQASKDK